ncbi:acid protease [Sistotremastrum suecicum HHB10207 ss-3]|uniref:Acid protease n=1 Tax=Sistotremastrum suecicum HHB10207 ss-3 TaxID=1314776 RepID=A0A166FHN6_9AGAM|nr:acid protease [Sistotremastrum suecicum HHB10207 ss-3]
MHAFFISLLTFTLLATAAPSPRRAVQTIALTKRSKFLSNGFVNITALRGHIAYIEGSTGGDSLTDDNGQLWFGQISVGTPPVTYTVDFDTGSSDLFLPSVDCDNTCAGHTPYDPSQSSTSSDVGNRFSLAFGDGSTVSGQEFTDSVTISGLTAQNQILGSSTTYSTGFESSQFVPDGLMGLAFPEIAQMGTPFFNTLIQQGSVSAGEFGMKLTEQGAELFLGGVDDKLVGGDFTTVPVTQPGFWQVEMDSANVNGQAVVQGISAIVDSGTTLIVGDSKRVSEFYNAIEGAKDASATFGPGFFSFPCSSSPSVSLTFGGTAFDFSNTFSLGPAQQGSSDCIGGVIASDTGIDGWITGDVFMSNVYTAFSFDKTTVSFAPLA